MPTKKYKILVDRLITLLKSSITQLIITLIFAAIAISGKLSVNFSCILLVIAFLVGCFGIFQTEVPTHLRIIYSFILAILLFIFSLWITSIRPDNKAEQSIKQPSTYIIADCTFDIIFQISEQDLKILKSFKQDISNGTIFAQVNIFEKDSPFRFIQLSIMGTWHNTDSRIFDSVEDLTLFSLRTKQFMFSRKKATIGNAQSGMTKLSSHRKYNIQIRGSIVENGNIIILTPTSATIRTHEGIVFPAIEFKRMENNEYWQAEFSSIPIQYLISD